MFLCPTNTFIRISLIVSTAVCNMKPQPVQTFLTKSLGFSKIHTAFDYIGRLRIQRASEVQSTAPIQEGRTIKRLFILDLNKLLNLRDSTQESTCPCILLGIPLLALLLPELEDQKFFLGSLFFLPVFTKRKGRFFLSPRLRQSKRAIAQGNRRTRDL